MRSYITRLLNGMALGLFCSLIVGLILKQLGTSLNIPAIRTCGIIAQHLMGAAIGIGVAQALGAPSLVLISSLIAGSLGAGSILISESTLTLSIGEPMGALVATWLSVSIAKRIVGRTPIDIVLIPSLVILIGGLAGAFVSTPIALFMKGIGELINYATIQKPFVMGLLVSVLMGIVLTLPISSAAIGISLGLHGLAAGAALVGCAAHMIGFAIASYKDNGVSGLIAQGLGTSMIQISNIIKKPIIMLPAIISSAILGPISTCIVGIEADAIGSGMGTSGLVGPISAYALMGADALPQIVLMLFVCPAIIAGVVAFVLRQKKLITSGDMEIRS